MIIKVSSNPSLSTVPWKSAYSALSSEHAEKASQVIYKQHLNLQNTNSQYTSNMHKCMFLYYNLLFYKLHFCKSQM